MGAQRLSRNNMDHSRLRCRGRARGRSPFEVKGGEASRSIADRQSLLWINVVPHAHTFIAATSTKLPQLAPSSAVQPPNRPSFEQSRGAESARLEWLLEGHDHVLFRHRCIAKVRASDQRWQLRLAYHPGSRCLEGRLRERIQSGFRTKHSTTYHWLASRKTASCSG